MKVELDDKETPLKERVFQAVFTVGRGGGYNAGKVEDYKPDAHTCLDSSVMITPEWFDSHFTGVMYDENGVFGHLNIEAEFDGVFGTHSGASATTAVHVRAGHTVAETVGKMIKNGSIDRAIEHAQVEFQVGEKEAERKVFFGIAHFAVGWATETTLCEIEEFNKGSIGHDIGGIDAYRGNEEIQIKSVTSGYKHNKVNQEKYETVIYYHYDCQNNRLVYGENHKEVTREATKDSDKTMTLTAQAAGNVKACKKFGRTFRYITY